MSLFKKGPLTLRVDLKHGNRLSEIFNDYDKALKKLSKLEWLSYDISYEYVKRPDEIETLSQYEGFDLYFKYTDSEWDLMMMAIEEAGAQIKFRC